MRKNSTALIAMGAAIMVSSPSFAGNQPMKGSYHVQDSLFDLSPQSACQGLPDFLGHLQQGQSETLEGTFFYPGPAKAGAAAAYDTQYENDLGTATTTPLSYPYGKPELLTETFPVTPIIGAGTWSGTGTLVVQTGNSAISVPVSFSETIRYVNARSFMTTGTITLTAASGPCMVQDQATFVRTGN
jgi:hypothetical protein